MRAGSLRGACSRSSTACGGTSRLQQQPLAQQLQQQQQSPLSLLLLAPPRRRRACVHVMAGKGFGSLRLPAKRDLWNGRVPLKPHDVSPMRPVPPGVPRPPYADSGKLPPIDRRPQIHTPEGLVKMRAACKLAAQVLAAAGKLVAPGVTTDAIDAAVHDMVTAAGAYPSPLNYGKFPKSVCTSVNEVMCHGIPDARPLRDGDIVNIDVTVFLNGYHGDTSRTFFVGSPSPAAQRLVAATEEALAAAIQVCGPGVPFTEVGAACSAVAAKHKLTVVRDFIGHGVGTVFHAAPHVFHHKNNEREGNMQVGQTFTIEPIFAEGSNKVVMWQDAWTATTSDGGLASQCEHTVLITPGGHEVLTLA